MKQKRSRRRLHPHTVLLIRQVMVGTMVFTFFGLLISSIWFGTRVNALTLETIVITGGETIPHGDIEAKLRSTLQGSYLGIVPKAFAFTYPKEVLYTEVRTIDRIKDISITRVGGKELHVNFSEYTPHALWCRGENEGGCLFLDDSGYAFGDAPNLTGGSLLRVVAIGRGPELRTQAFSSETYKTVNDVVEQLAEINWYVSRVDIDSADDAFTQIVNGGEFKLSLKTPAADTLNNLQTILASESFIHLKPGNFQYVDLRFGSKVFVNETTTASSTASTTDLVVPEETFLEQDPVVITPDEDETTVIMAEELVVEETAATSSAE